MSSMGQTSDRLRGCRLSDEWTFRGMRMAVLENEHLRVVVALDRGAEIVEFRAKQFDLDPLLHMPGGPRTADTVTPAMTSAATAFVDLYAGGWQEILPNGGPPSIHAGASYGQHGEVSLLPWTLEVEEDRTDRISVVCRVRAASLPLLLERRMTLLADRLALYLDERLTNDGPDDVDVMWGHHVAFGRPFLDRGGRIDTPARRVLVHDELPGSSRRRLAPGQDAVWPIARGVDGGELDLRVLPPPGAERTQEMCYLTAFPEAAWYAISAPPLGFAMRWDRDVFKYLWLWQELEAGTGHPWLGRTYAVALEPWTSYPTDGLAEAVRRGTHLVVPANDTVETSLVAVAFETDGAEVGDVWPDGAVSLASSPLDPPHPVGQGSTG
jgi:galactose mutarotase-like enzyme